MDYSAQTPLRVAETPLDRKRCETNVKGARWNPVRWFETSLIHLALREDGS
ncbi:hypothetical protein [Acetobacter sp. DsW_063]|uniref:hypothetical protein n=1 Tax=Acetobacter sp. DsW_063 TaxID=1514894 RepID=UPI0013022CE9|nr:hypothetical protein [Acetobacter sp. DsW_063]